MERNGVKKKEPVENNVTRGLKYDEEEAEAAGEGAGREK